MLGRIDAVDPSTLETLSKLGPIATAVAAVVALIVGIFTVTQRGKADRRDQWWKRAQWAFELTLDEDPQRQAVGLRAMQYLAGSKLTGKDEAQLLEAAWVEPLAEFAPDGDTDLEGTGTEATSSAND